LPAGRLDAQDQKVIPARALKNKDNLRIDILAGITVALVLVPQSMAYPQLAGLPV